MPTMIDANPHLSSDEATLSRGGWILFAVSILGAMIQIDYTAVNVALIAMAKTVNADLRLIQWVLSGYVLAWGAFVLTAGRLADLFGKRRTFLIGTSLFMLGSAFAGFATQTWFLIFGRIIQGIGGALFLPGLYTLVFTAFPENKRGFALGVLTSAIAIGLAIGPTFGGVVLQVLNWRWIFFLNLPLGLPVIGIILWAVKREPLRSGSESMDYLGAVLITLALFLIIGALDQANFWGMTSVKFWVVLGIGLALLIAFISYQRQQTYPLVPPSLFSNQIFLGCSLSYIFTGFNFSVTLLVISLYLQNALGYSAFNTGFIFLVMTIMFALCSIYGGKLIDRIEPRIPIILGSISIAISSLIFAHCTQHTPLWIPVLALALVGLGIGLNFPGLNATMLKSVPNNLLNTASSVFTMFGCIGNTLGLIFSSTVLINFSKRELHELVTQHGELTTEQQTALFSVINSTHYDTQQFSQFPADIVTDLLNILRTAFIHGVSVSMWIAFALTVVAIIISLSMVKSPRKSL